MEVVAASTTFCWSPHSSSSYSSPSLHFSLSLLRSSTPTRATTPTSSVSRNHVVCRTHVTHPPFFDRPRFSTTGSLRFLAYNDTAGARSIATAATGDFCFPSSNDLDGDKESVREFQDITDRLRRGPIQEDVTGDDSDGSNCCSAKKAFSSLVFMIRELQSHTLRLRELLFHEDPQRIVAGVHADMHASFCWLFYQIFSRTPTLMLSLMLLLANFTVHSMAAHRNAKEAITRPPPVTAAADVQIVHGYQTNDYKDDKDHLREKRQTFSIGGGREAPAWVRSNGRRKVKPMEGQATDDGRPPSETSPREERYIDITTRKTPSSSGAPVVSVEEDEAMAWKRTLEVARMMTAETRHEALMDDGNLLRFVSPVRVDMEADGEYSNMDAMYQAAVKDDPDSSLFLSNYAQFLYLFLHDHQRAEYYFKRAVEVKPADAEALRRYANFLWQAKNEVEAAEEAYLEAIAVEPGNVSYAAQYAHFLWNTGGEDTCFPLDDNADDA